MGIDWGIISTAVATVIGSVATGLGTWATMRSKEKSLVDEAERDFITRLQNETKDLRQRIDDMQKLIDTLMEERRELKNQVVELEIKVKHLEGIKE